MSAIKWIIGAILLGAISAACADSGTTDADSAVGKVATVFVRESGGLFIEKKLLRKVEKKELWAAVRFANFYSDDANYELFKLPENVAIERGDLVAAKVGDTSGLAFKLLAEPNIVSQLVAKHDTLMAMTFGLPTSSQATEMFLTKKGQ